MNPKTGKPITKADMINSGEFTANSGVYQQAPRTVSPQVAAPAPVPFDASKYLQQFSDSYGAAQSSIRAGLQQSLGQLQGRRDQAAAIVAGMPQLVNSNFQSATQANTRARATAGKGDSATASGVANDMQATNDQALATEKAAALGSRPYMDLGITANTQSGEAALNAEANRAQAEAQAQHDAFQQSMAMAAAQMGYQHDEKQLDRDFAASQAAAAANSDPWKEKAQFAIDNQPSALDPTLTNGQVREAQGSDAYKSYAAKIAGGGKDNGQIAYELRQPGNEAVSLILHRQFPTFFEGENPTATGAKTNPIADEWTHAPISTSGKLIGAGTRRIWHGLFG